MIEYEWDEAKRRWTLDVRGLDFADAHLVYEAEAKVTLVSFKKGESRWQDIALVEVKKAVLALVYTRRAHKIRIISMRKASREERQLYANRKPDRLGTREA